MWGLILLFLIWFCLVLTTLHASIHQLDWYCLFLREKDWNWRGGAALQITVGHWKLLIAWKYWLAKETWKWQKWPTTFHTHRKRDFNPIQDGLFWGCSWIGGGAFWPPLPKISHTYSTTIKLGTVIPYLRKIHKMYKLRDTFF